MTAPDTPTTVRVPLVGGQSALIDAADAKLIAGYRWRSLATPTGRFYAYAQPATGGPVYMHRLIADTPAGMVTDHINNDGLDNRRANLRSATWTQNVANVEKIAVRGGAPTTSQYKGVSWDKARSKWAASAKIGDKHTHLGRYESEVEAARAYDAAVYAAHGEFAYLNFPDRVAEPSPHKPGRKKPPPRTHCPQRHEYTPENTAINRFGYRICKTCRKQSDAARWAAGKTAKQLRASERAA